MGRIAFENGQIRFIRKNSDNEDIHNRVGFSCYVDDEFREIPCNEGLYIDLRQNKKKTVVLMVGECFYKLTCYSNSYFSYIILEYNEADETPIEIDKSFSGYDTTKMDCIPCPSSSDPIPP